MLTHIFELEGENVLDKISHENHTLFSSFVVAVCPRGLLFRFSSGNQSDLVVLIDSDASSAGLFCLRSHTISYSGDGRREGGGDGETICQHATGRDHGDRGEFGLHCPG